MRESGTCLAVFRFPNLGAGVLSEISGSALAASIGNFGKGDGFAVEHGVFCWTTPKSIFSQRGVLSVSESMTCT